MPDSIIATPTITGDELIGRFLQVIREEARSNPRFRRELIAVLCNVVVVVPAEEFEVDAVRRAMRGVPW